MGHGEGPEVRTTNPHIFRDRTQPLINSASITEHAFRFLGPKSWPTHQSNVCRPGSLIYEGGVGRGADGTKETKGETKTKDVQLEGQHLWGEENKAKPRKRKRKRDIETLHLIGEITRAMFFYNFHLNSQFFVRTCAICPVQHPSIGTAEVRMQLWINRSIDDVSFQRQIHSGANLRIHLTKDLP